MRYKIVVAYDGTDYRGWQRQHESPTIQGTLEETFAAIFNHHITILGTSRTDAGVHALAQIAIFTTDINATPAQMMRAWNARLPAAMSIRSLEPVADDYSLHGYIEYKIYQYTFFQERPLPWHAPYGWYYHRPVDLKKLHDCLQVFVGTHDFRSFSTGDDRGNDTVRTIMSAQVEAISEYSGYRIIIKGPRFLHHMIRRIVGACLHVASRDTLNVCDLEKALAQRSPLQELPNAPAHGLLLYQIVYKGSHE